MCISAGFHHKTHLRYEHFDQTPAPVFCEKHGVDTGFMHMHFPEPAQKNRLTDGQKFPTIGTNTQEPRKIAFRGEGEVYMKKEALAQARNAYAVEAECLAKAVEYLDEEQFAKAVEALKNAPRIGAAGCGHSGIACQHFCHLMCCIERPARFISPAEAVHGARGFLKMGDVMLFASRGGKTDELLPILAICQKKGVTVITVTENLDSPLAKGADIVLRQYINRETDKYNCQGTTSTTSLCVIFHALQAALIEETDYQNEQFGLIHPGGAVGKRLN